MCAKHHVLDGRVLKKHTKNRFNNIKSFDVAFAPAGMLRRYAVGRSNMIRLRCSVIVIMSLFTALVLSPYLALVIVTIALPLELLECWVLRRWIARVEFHLDAAGCGILLASITQALGIGASIFLAGIQSDELRMIAWTLLLRAVINSMLVAHYHPESNRARLCVLSSFGFSVLVWGDIGVAVLWIDSIAMFLMGLMLWKMFTHLARRETRTHLAERELIVRSEEAERLALVAKYASEGVLLMDTNLNII